MAKNVKQKLKANGKEFKAPKHPEKDTTSEVALVFDDLAGIEVELLEMADLPPAHNGQPVTWFNNFAVKKNGAYLKKGDNVSYAIHFDPIPAGTTFVYFDGEKTCDDLHPGPSDRAGKQKVTFQIGDPGIGWV
jgi:hypothetical protein